MEKITKNAFDEEVEWKVAMRLDEDAPLDAWFNKNFSAAEIRAMDNRKKDEAVKRYCEELKADICKKLLQKYEILDEN